MARWWHVFIYNGPAESCEAFGRVFPRGERVTISLPAWSKAEQREASSVGLDHLEVFDAGARKASRKKAESAGASAPAPSTKPVSAPAPPRTTRRRRDSQWR
jgi:hypothetical protein